MDVRAIISHWPSLTAFCADVGATYGQARKWSERNRIPPEHWCAVVDAARLHSFNEITFETLARMAAGEK